MTGFHEFWTLLIDAAWKSTALLISGLVLTRWFGRTSAAIRHLMWTSVLAGLLMLPAVRMAAPSLAIAPVISIPASVRSGIQQIAARPMSMGAQFALAWAGGALLMLLRLAMAILRARRIAASAMPLNVNWPSLPSAPVEILHSGALSVPVAAGVFHPRIILPSDACQWPPERLRLVVAHEMAHVLRRDCGLNVLIEIVRSVYWFHPLFWLAARKCREQAEKACDDYVLANGADAASYAAHLVWIARAAKSFGVPSVAAAAVTRASLLEQRLVAILDQTRDRAPINRRTAIAAAAVARLSAFCSCAR